jgi:type I restriction enzyme S subunit
MKTNYSKYDEVVKSQFIEMSGTLKEMKTSNIKLKDVLVVNPKKDNLDDMLMVSFLPMEKVGVDGSIDTSVIRKYVDVKKGFNQIKENDVLFAKITPCMENGKSTIARNLKNGYACSTTELFCLRCFDIVVPEYIFSIVHSKEFRVEAEKNMTGSAGQKRVPKSFIEEFPIIVPSLQLQNKFADFVKLIDKSKFIIQKQIKLLEELLEKKMNKYFGD